MLNNRVDIIGREKRAISPTDQLSESPVCASTVSCTLRAYPVSPRYSLCFKRLKAWDGSDNSENWRTGLSVTVQTPLHRTIREGMLKGRRLEKMTLEDLLRAWACLCRVAPRMTSLQAQWDNVAALAPLGMAASFPRTFLRPGNMLIIVVCPQARSRRGCPPS